VNPFGAMQFPERHDEVAGRFFEAFYQQGLFVGQLRSSLGIPGRERTGPEQAARALMDLLKNKTRLGDTK
jgi:hypothetical protein